MLWILYLKYTFMWIPLGAKVRLPNLFLLPGVCVCVCVRMHLRMRQTQSETGGPLLTGCLPQDRSCQMGVKYYSVGPHYRVKH